MSDGYHHLALVVWAAVSILGSGGFAAHAGDVAGRVAMTTATMCLAVVATAVSVAAGLVALTAAAGFPVA